MHVVIGIDPHKASHTEVAIDEGEDELSSVRVRATWRQVDQLVRWAEPFEQRLGGFDLGVECTPGCNVPKVVPRREP